MYCGECGSKISDDAKFCPACGAKTEKAASASAEASFFTAEESAKESPAPWTGLDHGPPRGRAGQVILVAKSRPSVRAVDANCPNWFLSLS